MNAAIYEYSRFTVVKEMGKVNLVAELSDFGPGTEVFRRLYPDACDLGLTIVGKKYSVDFYLASELRDDENELQGYVLRPTVESLRKVPASKNVQVTLYND